MSALGVLIAVAVAACVGIVGYLSAAHRMRAESDARITEAEKRALLAEATKAALEARMQQQESDLAMARKRLEEAQVARASAETALQAERNRLAEERKLLDEASARFKDAFDSLAAQALKSNNESFLELAKTTLERYQSEAHKDLEQRQQAVGNLVTPISEALRKVDQQIQEMEKARSHAYGSLSEQVKSLVSTQQKLETEAGNLVKALRAPTVRGRWGEIQLRRVVELAGMLPYCDFVEQASVSSGDGRLRPDLIVRLPGGKNLVVDSKAPLAAYLEALEASDEDDRQRHLIAHARQIRDHVTKLSSKAYWEQFRPTPEFVVMFLPGETFFSVALEQDPSLIEEGINQRVIPASPTTLIALLRAVAYGWNQERLAANAELISELGRELYERLRTFAAHVETVGRNLDRAVEAYNKAVGSLETRVMISARKFVELGTAAKEEIPEFAPIERTVRALQAADRGSEKGSRLGAGVNN